MLIYDSDNNAETYDKIRFSLIEEEILTFASYPSMVKEVKNISKFQSKRHSTSNRCRFDVYITSICQRPDFDEFPRHFHVLFDVISLVEKSMLFPHTFFSVILLVKRSTLFPRTSFRCNFAGRKIHVVSTYFFRCNFSSRNIRGVCTYSFQRNFYDRKIHFVCVYVLFSTKFGWAKIRRRFW